MPLDILPAPGFMFFLVGRLFVGYSSACPSTALASSFGPIVLLVAGIGFYTFVQQLPDMASGYAGAPKPIKVGYAVFQFVTATWCRRRRRPQSSKVGRRIR